MQSHSGGNHVAGSYKAPNYASSQIMYESTNLGGPLEFEPVESELSSGI